MIRVRLVNATQNESPCALRRSGGNLGEGMLVSSSKPFIDGDGTSHIGSLGYGRFIVDAWWFMVVAEDEEDGEVVICIWREFIGRKWFVNGMSLS
ncbi:hypothetical protein Tco_1428860 [Tanacetum coccineum]